jgi:hypothetical protein
MADEKKFLVVFKNGTTHYQIDDFPENCKRSSIGSLHVKSGSYMLTKDEINHIKSYKFLASFMTIHKMKEEKKVIPKKTIKNKTVKK